MIHFIHFLLYHSRLPYSLIIISIDKYFHYPKSTTLVGVIGSLIIYLYATFIILLISSSQPSISFVVLSLSYYYLPFNFLYPVNLSYHNLIFRSIVSSYPILSYHILLSYSVILSYHLFMLSYPIILT